MHVIGTALLLTMWVWPTLATVHTDCYNYFRGKDGCVVASADDRTRCGAQKQVKGATVKFQLRAHRKRDEIPALVRRYDTTGKVFPVAGGDGICGPYDTNGEEGVCLFSGDSTTHPSGWVNGVKTSNCGKRVYIQRQGRPETVVYAKVRDGCSFNTADVTVGCFQIALTNRTFNALQPTDEERRQEGLYGITWDFDNLHGNSPQQAPV